MVRVFARAIVTLMESAKHGRAHNRGRGSEGRKPKTTFTHTRLIAANSREYFRFYRETMGFEVLWGDEDSSYADFEAGETDLGLFKRDAMAEAVGANNLPMDQEVQDDVCLIFAVENVDHTVQELKQKGVQFVTEPKDYQSWGIRAAHFRDPDGTLIEINQGLGSG